MEEPSLFYSPIIQKAEAAQTTPEELKGSVNLTVTDGFYNQNTVQNAVYIDSDQHFSLNHSQTFDISSISSNFKSVSNSEFFRVFVGPLPLLKSEGERG